MSTIIKKRVLIIHNKIMHYREPLFKALQEMFDLEIIITKEPRPIKASRGLCINYLNSKDNISENLLSIFNLLRILLRKRSDVIIGGNWDDFIELSDAIISVIISRIRSIPFILWTESWNYDRKTISLRRKIADPLIHFIIRMSTAHIVPGSKSRDMILHYGGKAERIFIAPNSSSICTKLNIDKRMNESFMNRPLTFLFLGRLVEVKGVIELLKAYSIVEKEIRNVRLLIGGSGPLEGLMKEISEQLGIRRCEFRGWISLENRSSIFLESDVLVLPSKFHNGFCEAWGLVMNEAMSCGLPVIATNATGGAFDLIINGVTGFMIKEGDTDELASAMIAISRNRQLIKWMGDEARKRIEANFTMEKMVSGFINAINISLNTGN